MSDFVLTNSGATITITNISNTMLLKVENGIISPTLINKNLNETEEVPVYAIQVPSFMSYKYNTIQPGDSITFESTNKDEILYYYGISKNPFAGISVIVTPNGGSEDNNAQFSDAASFGSPAISSLLSIKIPEGVTSIGPRTFTGATRLKTVTIPSTMTYVASGSTQAAFAECTAIETITINKPEGSITGAPWGAPETTQIIWNG